MYLESAAFVTGETLHIDGAQSAGHWLQLRISRATTTSAEGTYPRSPCSGLRFCTSKPT
jgi:hypothetical protein